MMAISSVLWVALASDMLVNDRADEEASDYVGEWCQLSSAILFTAGSVFMIGSAYPEAIEAAHESALASGTVDFEQVPWIERYFTGNDLLLASWFFSVCTLPFLPVGTWLVLNKPWLFEGYLYVAGSILACAALGVWVVGAMPENRAANCGQGSTHLYDALFRGPCLNAVAPEEFWREYFLFDLTNGMWLFAIGSFFGLGYGAGAVALEPRALYSWLGMSTSATFFLGASLMLHSYLHENKSTLIYSCCCGRGECCGGSMEEPSEDLLDQGFSDPECPLLAGGDIPIKSRSGGKKQRDTTGNF